jgi:hypothetical protein
MQRDNAIFSLSVYRPDFSAGLFQGYVVRAKIMQTSPGALRRPRNAVRGRNLDANEATAVDGAAMSLARNAGGPVRREPPPLVS